MIELGPVIGSSGRKYTYVYIYNSDVREFYMEIQVKGGCVAPVLTRMLGNLTLSAYMVRPQRSNDCYHHQSWRSTIKWTVE